MRKRYFLASFFFLLNSSFSLGHSLLSETQNKIDDISQIKVDPNYLNFSPENDYIIGPGDVLNILISRDYPELLTLPKLVDGEGTIYLPRLNRVYVSGLSVDELNDILNEAFKKFVKYPSVEVTVTGYRPIRVFVDGEVTSPGMKRLEGSASLNSPDSSQYVEDYSQPQDRKNFNTSAVPTAQSLQYSKFSTDIKNSNFFPTVFDAIRKSDGITEYSDLSNIELIRQNKVSAGGGKITTTLDLSSLLNSGDNSQNIRIYDSDIIRVKRAKKPNKKILTKAILSNLNNKFLEVSVLGRVNLPGLTKVSKASSLNDAIDMAGGTKVMKGPATFLRFNNDGTIDKRRFGLSKRAKRGSFKNPLLRNGDLILVGESPLTATNQVLTEIFAPFVGIYSTYGIIKAISGDD
mgnify:CR=1 FL=1